MTDKSNRRNDSQPPASDTPTRRTAMKRIAASLSSVAAGTALVGMTTPAQASYYSTYTSLARYSSYSSRYESYYRSYRR